MRNPAKKNIRHKKIDEIINFIILLNCLFKDNLNRQYIKLENVLKLPIKPIKNKINNWLLF